MVANSVDAAVTHHRATASKYAGSGPVISVRGLRKRYGDHEAVRGIDLEIQRGEIFAFLGPNGAGKTTTVEIMERFRQATDGDVQVLGTDPWRASSARRARHSALSTQHSALSTQHSALSADA